MFCGFNKKKYEQQISILEWFLKENVTEDWSKKCWKSSFASQELQKLHFKI